MNFISAADLQFDLYLLSIRSPFFVSLFKWVTWFGNEFVVVALTLLAGILLWRSLPLRIYALGLVTTVFGAGGTAYILKYLVGRARPVGLIPAIVETSPSFPSGHATLSMALYGFAAYVLCRQFPEKKPLIITATTLIILLVGFSRLYLGAHFPSDVLAGYIVGGLWLFISIRTMRVFSSKQRV